MTYSYKTQGLNCTNSYDIFVDGSVVDSIVLNRTNKAFTKSKMVFLAPGKNMVGIRGTEYSSSNCYLNLYNMSIVDVHTNTNFLKNHDFSRSPKTLATPDLTLFGNWIVSSGTGYYKGDP